MEETLVNESAVVGVQRHATVGAASPPDVVWPMRISVGYLGARCPGRESH